MGLTGSRSLWAPVRPVFWRPSMPTGNRDPERALSQRPGTPRATGTRTICFRWAISCAHAWGCGDRHMVISTACSSSAKVFATAARFLQAGLCDAAIVGGVDSLCHTTLYGFSALQLLSTQSLPSLRRRSRRALAR